MYCFINLCPLVFVRGNLPLASRVGGDWPSPGNAHESIAHPHVHTMCTCLLLAYTFIYAHIRYSYLYAIRIPYRTYRHPHLLCLRFLASPSAQLRHRTPPAALAPSSCSWVVPWRCAEVSPIGVPSPIARVTIVQHSMGPSAKPVVHRDRGGSALVQPPGIAARRLVDVEVTLRMT